MDHDDDFDDRLMDFAEKAVAFKIDQLYPTKTEEEKKALAQVALYNAGNRDHPETIHDLEAVVKYITLGITNEEETARMFQVSASIRVAFANEFNIDAENALELMPWLDC